MLPSTENIYSLQHYISANSNVELNNQYSLKIVIESIFWIKDLKHNDITISFYNPVYHKFYTIPNPINVKINEFTYLDDIQCRMTLEIPNNQVKYIFPNWSPTVIICNKENKILTQCSLDLKAFKLNKSKQRTFQSKTLYAMHDENEKLAEINIILTAYDENIVVSNQENPSIGFFYRISEQLENWKKYQKQIFKKQEEEKINLLVEDWKKEKFKLQEKIVKNIQDTNNVLQEIKKERDILKARVEEFKKHSIDHTYNVDSKISTNQKNIKNRDIHTKTIHIREKKELDEHKTTIKKQSDEIKALREQYQGTMETFENMLQTMDDLKIQMQLKESETEYLKQQWAKTTRELNSYKKNCNNIEAKHTATHNAMLPLLIQQLLDSDAAEQKTDLEQLRLIDKELKGSSKKRVQIVTDKPEPSEIDILLKTNTYNHSDKVIQLLNRKNNC